MNRLITLWDGILYRNITTLNDWRGLLYKINLKKTYIFNNIYKTVNLNRKIICSVSLSEFEVFNDFLQTNLMPQRVTMIAFSFT